MLIFPVDHLPRLITVGVQTSKGVEEIGFNVSAWLDKWPDMTFEVWPTRPTETAAYPAVCQLIGDVLVWYVSDADTAFEGLGTVEVVGVAEGVRKPSGPCTTEIKKTSLGVTQDPPAGIKPYYEGMMEVAQAVRDAADEVTGGKALFLVTTELVNGVNTANRTIAEIQQATLAGRAVILSEGSVVYTFTDYRADHETGTGYLPTFSRPVTVNDQGDLYVQHAQIREDGSVTAYGTPESMLYLVTASKYADRTPAAIRAAAAAGKTLLLIDKGNGWVYTYIGITTEYKTGNNYQCPSFASLGSYVDGTGLGYKIARVLPDGEMYFGQYTFVRTPNPKKLKLTGAVEAEYDGSEKVEIKIPSGVEDPGTAHQQLVSDASGKAVWVDRLAYPYTGQVEVLPETALTYMGEEGEIQLHALTTPLPTMPEKGKTYNVVYNGTAYDCPVAYGYDEGGMGGQLVLGNPQGEDGGNSDAPFTFIVLEDEAKGAEFGFYAMCAALDGATSVTISITGEGTVYKKLPEEYLPDNRVVTAHAALTKMNTTDIEFGEWDMTFDELWEAFNAGHDVRVLCAATGNASGDNPTNDQVVGRIDYAQEIPSTGGKLMRMRMPWSLFNDTERLIAISTDDSGAMVFTQITAD